MNLFNFIKIIFKDTSEYSKIPKRYKNNLFFMVNRFMSINFPIQAELFNNINISTDRVIDYWHKNLKGKKSWYFPKSKKIKKNKTDKLDIPKEESINLYLNKKFYNKKQLRDAIFIFGDDAYNPIRKLEEYNK